MCLSLIHILGMQFANSETPTVELGGETYQVELVYADNGSSTDKAPSAASQLVSEGVSVVLGSYGSGVSIAAGPTFGNAGLPAIGVTCTNPRVTAGNDYYFRICFLDPFQGTVLANFAMEKFQAKTAYLALVLKAAGAEVYATGCNPLSTQDDVAAGLASLGVNVFAWHAASAEEYKEHLTQTLSCHPDLFIDDGGDMLEMLCSSCAAYADRVLGGCAETTTGVTRLKARAKAGALPFPMMNVNDAQCKHYYDNKYGTGQSVWDAIMHTTNLLVAGKTVVVAGYGYCGRGLSLIHIF